MSKIKSEYQEEIEQREVSEPQDYERFAMTPEQEKEFEQWARRLVPAHLREPF